MQTRGRRGVTGPVADDPKGDDVAAEGGSGAVGPGDEKPRTEAAAPAPPVAQGPPGAGGPGQGQPGPGQPDPGHPDPQHPDPEHPDPEHPDPGRIATQPDFGRELTRARQRAGLTVREVARAVGIPASTAGDYFAGRHLPPPSQPGLLPRILRVCGETDPDRLTEWMSTLNRIRRGPGRRTTAAAAPYRGLASFQPEDAAWFFGREDLTARLVGLASAAPAPGVPLTVVGPSGSGKSSLLRAGLIPSMPDWPRRRLALFTPGATPLRELARQLALLDPGRDPADPDPADPAILAGTSRVEAVLRSDPGEVPRLAPGLTPDGSDPRLLIVVDQFEEIFTACRDEAERQRFITAICALTGPAVVVAALRADFYDRALRFPELARALQERQVVVVPMTRHEVRSAIVEPASLARLAVEDGLVELLLRDLAPHAPDGGPAGAAHEAGALPLLSHALLTTWSHSHGGRLTVADYQASGGIRNAIARTADLVYEALDEDQRDIARRLFLRLVYVADDAPETRRSVPLAELRNWPGEAATSGQVLGRFVAERLITVDAETAQITHEALLTAWPLLRAWIDANREGLRVRRRLSDAARAWDEAGTGSAPPCSAAASWPGQGLGCRSGQPGQPGHADRGVRGRGDRGGAGAAGRGAEPRAAAAPARRGADRAGPGDRRAGRVRLPAAPGSDPRAGQRDRSQEHRPVARGGHRGRPGPRAERRAGGPAEPGCLPDRADRRRAGQPAGVVRQPGRGPADRLGRGGPGGQPQPRSPAARGGRRGRLAPAVERGPARSPRPGRRPAAGRQPPGAAVRGGVQPGRLPPRRRGRRADRDAVEHAGPGPPGPASPG